MPTNKSLHNKKNSYADWFTSGFPYVESERQNKGQRNASDQGRKTLILLNFWKVPTINMSRRR